MIPALGFLAMYERLLDKARKGKLTTLEAELAISGFNQAALYKYEQARALSIALLRDWLAQYKFRDWTQTQTTKKTVTPKMRVKRAEEIAKKLNDTDKWHSHGHGISMEVLRRDLNLQINDFEDDPELVELIRNYYSLMTDYAQKLGKQGVLHTTGDFSPFA